MKDYELLDAIGGIDAAYVTAASSEAKRGGTILWKRILPVAACLCLVIGGLAVLSGKKADTPIPIQDLSGAPVTESTEQSGDYAPMIVIDGTTYRDTYKQYEGSIDVAAIRRSTSYVDGYPAQDGEQNFYRDNTDYILLNDGTVICRIDGGWRVFEPCASADGQRNERDVEEPTVDVPVDESTYSEACVYSGDILDLQNRISAAMTNHELPFVTTSAILENPDRIHVTVTTTDEDAIALLKSFDTTGKLLEIEYVTGTVTVEDEVSAAQSASPTVPSAPSVSLNPLSDSKDTGYSDVAAAEASARAYYKQTVFTVIDMQLRSQTVNEIIFSVRSSKDGIIQEPDRSITLNRDGDQWIVVGEGY